MAIAVLHHHNRCVDEHTYGQREAPKRHDVGTDVQEVHGYEGRQYRDAQNKLKEAKTRLRNAEDQAEQAAQLADRAHSGMHGLVEAAKEQLRNSEGSGFRPIKTLHDDRFGEMEMRLEEEVGFLRSTICDLEDCLQRLDEATSRCNRSTTGWRSSTLADRVGGTHINFLPPLPGYLGFPLSPSSSPPLVRPLLPPTPQWPIREGNCLSTWTAFPSSYQSSHYLNPLGNSGALSLNFMGSSVRPVELNPPKLDLLVKYGVRPEEVLGEGDCKNYYYKKVNSWWQGGGCELEDFGVRPEMVLGEGSCKNYMYEKANSWWRSPAPSLSFGGSTFGSNSIFQPPPLRFG